MDFVPFHSLHKIFFYFFCKVILKIRKKNLFIFWKNRFSSKLLGDFLILKRRKGWVIRTMCSFKLMVFMEKRIQKKCFFAAFLLFRFHSCCYFRNIKNCLGLSMVLLLFSWNPLREGAIAVDYWKFSDDFIYLWRGLVFWTYLGILFWDMDRV